MQHSQLTRPHTIKTLLRADPSTHSLSLVLVRFRRTVSHLRETLTNDAQQASLGFGGLGGRAGTTLSLSIKRTQILEDALRILGEVRLLGKARHFGENSSRTSVPPRDVEISTALFQFCLRSLFFFTRVLPS